MEDDNSVVGFAAAAADAKELQRRIQLVWLPEMRAKYPDLMQWNSVDPVTIPDSLKVLNLTKLSKNDASLLGLWFSFLQDLAVCLQRLQSNLPDTLLTYHPSQLKIRLLDSVIDNSVSKRLLTCAVAALRAHGKASSDKITIVLQMCSLQISLYDELITICGCINGILCLRNYKLICF